MLHQSFITVVVRELQWQIRIGGARRRLQRTQAGTLAALSKPLMSPDLVWADLCALPTWSLRFAPHASSWPQDFRREGQTEINQTSYPNQVLIPVTKWVRDHCDRRSRRFCSMQDGRNRCSFKDTIFHEMKFNEKLNKNNLVCHAFCLIYALNA